MLEEGNQRVRSRVLFLMCLHCEQILLVHFAANTYKTLLRFGLSRWYSGAAELVRREGEATVQGSWVGWVCVFFCGGGELSCPTAGWVLGLNPTVVLAMWSFWETPRVGRARWTGPHLHFTSLGTLLRRSWACWKYNRLLWLLEAPLREALLLQISVEICSTCRCTGMEFKNT